MPDEKSTDYYDFVKSSMQGGLQEELRSTRLGTILLKKGIIDPQKLESALQEQKKSDERLGAVLIRLGFATREQILSCMALQAGVPYLGLDSYEINQEAAKFLSKEIAEKIMAVVIDKIDDTMLVAMSDPTDQEAKNNLQAFMKGKRFNIFFSSAEEIEKKLTEIYQ